MVELEPVRPVTVFQAVFDQLSALLASDAFAPGDRLPSERELAEQLRVSRPSVREALKALRALGLVEVRGRSTYVKGRRAGEPALVLPLEEVELLEISDFREAIETQIAALAAERATSDDLRALEHAAAPGGAQPDNAVVADRRFHRALAEAAHSRLLMAAHAQIHEHDLVQPRLQEAERHAGEVPGAREEMLAAHRQIVDAVRRGDATKARRLMHDHLARLRRSIVVGALGQTPRDGREPRRT